MDCERACVPAPCRMQGPLYHPQEAPQCCEPPSVFCGLLPIYNTDYISYQIHMFVMNREKPTREQTIT